MSIYLKQLEEGKYYTISFDFNDVYHSKPINIIEIQVLIKLENSIKLKLLEGDKCIWYESIKAIQMFDEIPIKYYRKEKLKKIENELNEN
jgi:hypothetical protein